ncbi:hypothetical protein [Paenibacillus sp. NPDC057967]|uniref:hypothetical protein n=1 Tax=Paenibacillus sp. NPDC057967 TaxID=3346293 RepID=UPI0036D88939
MKRKNKRLLLAAFVLVLAIVVLQSKAVPKALASIAATLYVNSHYAGKNLSFTDVEYETHFGQYIVSFKNRIESIHLMMYPNAMPVFVQYDPLDTSR